MLQLNNKTPFSASFFLIPNEDAIDCLYINVKATFLIGQNWTLSKTQFPPQEGDEYWGEPAESSIKYPSDVHTGKASTDIIMNGYACAPEKKAVTQLDVGLSVGEVQKNVRVFGERSWEENGISAPKLFESMPLVYEKAYGGNLVKGEQVDQIDDHNPLGVGLQASHRPEGCSLPNLENPAELIREPKDAPMPACFAAMAPNWQPRAGYAGTYDDSWKSSRAPYLPVDFDKRFLNCAHPDLIYPDFLCGGEEINIKGMHPKGDIHFQLPTVKLSCKVRIGDTLEQPEFNMDTLILEPNQLRLSMVWKAIQPYGKIVKNISEIEVNMSR